MSAIGIDVGSTYTKYCIIDDSGREKLYAERTPIHQKVFFEERLRQLRNQSSDYKKCGIDINESMEVDSSKQLYIPVMSCGYGRRNVVGERSVSELSALAAGIQRISPISQFVLDIGGQDTKLIQQRDGKICSFFINSKCAAGCGLFLTNVLNMLGVEFKMLNLEDGILPSFRLSSTCAVFAQSEIIELLAKDIPEEEIVRAVLVQILTQAKNLLCKVDCGAEVIALSGGLTLIPGFAKIAEIVLEHPVLVPNNAAYLAAIGCAVMSERCLKW